MRMLTVAFNKWEMNLTIVIVLCQDTVKKIIARFICDIKYIYIYITNFTTAISSMRTFLYFQRKFSIH